MIQERMLALQTVSHGIVQEWIAYTSNRGGSFDIWLYRPQDGFDFQLTQGLGAEFSVPYWSPDRRRIAFIGMGNVILVMDTVSFTVARIDQIEPYTLLDWSPDSRSLAYVKNDRIVIYDTATHRSYSIRRREQAMPSGSLRAWSFCLRLLILAALRSSTAFVPMARNGDKSHI